jgi:hypothetical protein
MTSCAEENLLGYPHTRYYGENIFVHEFSHGIMSAIRGTDPDLYAAIQQAYKDAMAQGMSKNQYGSTNANEYWAEATQTWFWSNIGFEENGKWIDSPDDLKAYDPAIYELLVKVYPDHHIPMDEYYDMNVHPKMRAAQ